MSSAELENLERIGTLKREPPVPSELAGLRRSAEHRLADAEREDLSFDSRFDLAYDAAHALALYALRRAGYRTDKRYVVFQVLPHTVGLATGHWRVLAKAHEHETWRSTKAPRGAPILTWTEAGGGGMPRRLPRARGALRRAPGGGAPGSRFLSGLRQPPCVLAPPRISRMSRRR